jgi:hypothetical protein
MQAVAGLSAIIDGGAREVQTVSTRTDRTFPISSGTFTLGFNYDVRSLVL